MTIRVQAAFDAVPRVQFLPPDLRYDAAGDYPLSIGHGATNSQPSTVAYMLDLLDVAPGHRVLDVGSGSGWTTALLGELVGPAGEVIGVDIVPALVAMGRENLAGRWPWVRIELGADGVLGWPEAAPFDRILVSADGGAVPGGLEDQLAPGGRMVIPADHVMVVVDRAADGALSRRQAKGRFSFVPLR
ncbi:protein-L-isoaspartate O-methyltransferase family protein [Tessaracoccus sp. Z1128]